MPEVVKIITRILEMIEANMSLAGEALNLERDNKVAIERQREFDMFIHDIGKLRMQARDFLIDVKYEEVKE